MSNPLQVLLGAALGLAVLGGCAVGPDYARPAVPTPDYVHADDAGFSRGAPAVEWWQCFADAELNSLVTRAAGANLDLRAATATLRDARAALRGTYFDFAPTITANGSAVREQRSANSGFVGAPGVGDPVDFYDAGFDMAWELDFFGRVRRGVAAQRGELVAAEATYRDAIVSVTAEVARTYLELRGQQYRLEVAQRNEANQLATWELTQALLRGGRGTDLDIARALAQLENTRATIPPLEVAVARAIHRLGVLVGKPPAELRSELAAVQPLPQPPELIPVDDASELLRRRPDIRAAEGRLAAAVARQGVAVADLFPRVSLTGSWGFNALEADAIGDRDALRFRVGPSVSWAALDLGRVKARIDQADARAEGALAQYERTVLTALEETENALTRYSRARLSAERLRVSAAASARAAELARLRYRNGADSFLTVLDAERTQLEAEDRLAQAEIESSTAVVAVYKALGGGWENRASPPRAP
jgi:multidrug efflux system outer membrane protein